MGSPSTLPLRNPENGRFKSSDSSESSEAAVLFTDKHSTREGCQIDARCDEVTRRLATLRRMGTKCCCGAWMDVLPNELAWAEETKLGRHLKRRRRQGNH